MDIGASSGRWALDKFPMALMKRKYTPKHRKLTFRLWWIREDYNNHNISKQFATHIKFKIHEVEMSPNEDIEREN